jgi:hypothetical protein
MLPPNRQVELSSRIGDLVEVFRQFGLRLLSSYPEHVSELPGSRAVVVVPLVVALPCVVAIRPDTAGVALVFGSRRVVAQRPSAALGEAKWPFGRILAAAVRKWIERPSGGDKTGHLRELGTVAEMCARPAVGAKAARVTSPQWLAAIGAWMRGAIPSLGLDGEATLSAKPLRVGSTVLAPMTDPTSVVVLERSGAFPTTTKLLQRVSVSRSFGGHSMRLRLPRVPRSAWYNVAMGMQA